jgi:hypothetical protein
VDALGTLWLPHLVVRLKHEAAASPHEPTEAELYRALESGSKARLLFLCRSIEVSADQAVHQVRDVPPASAAE